MKLKQLPEDFVVKEIADIKLSEKGKYACFILKKKKSLSSIQQRKLYK